MRALSLALCLAVTSVTATRAAADTPEDVGYFTLDNGMEAVVIEDHRAPVVVQMVWYKIGSADEEPGKTGLAHYLEHLMFKGTDTLESGEFSQTVTANGGSDNAFTSYDYTAYFQRIASDRLPLIMEMEADRMQNLRIGEEDWQAERQVVLEERAQRTDSNPAALFGEERSAAQYLNHPYGRPVIGWRAEMMELTREDALDWYDRYYAPNNAILILAGDVTPERARELAEQFYGPIPPKEEVARDTRPQEPEQRAPRRLQMTDPRVPQPSLVRSILVPERNPGDQKTAAALTVLSELLGGSPQTSVLAQELVLTGKALYVGTSYDGYAVDPTSFYISMAPVQGADLDEAEAALDEVLAEFLAEGPDPAQLERVKTQIRAAQIYEQDSARGRAYQYGQGLATGLSVEDVDGWTALLSEVTEEDVMAAADLVLNSTASVTGWLLPPAAGNPDIQAESAPESTTTSPASPTDKATDPTKPTDQNGAAGAGLAAEPAAADASDLPQANTEEISE
ncbi:M16 family metallopeptidase [Paracoccus sediminicola]|uniref:M16 family metallopeptidase n=1 Tax=Paracoccus sediminicola TaxID=3017783 RepID=UPI0022F01B20|nr:pitrilysin family protein [Paracoccus sediminicola]WBU56853.1 pitrilysin family protein [Paracoccus sediminicola]